MLVSCRNASEARKIAQAVVAERLAACASVMPCSSFFEWKCKRRWENEALLLLKTTAARRRALAVRVAQLHSYALPGIEWWNTGAESRFAKWVAASTVRSAQH